MDEQRPKIYASALLEALKTGLDPVVRMIEGYAMAEEVISQHKESLDILDAQILKESQKMREIVGDRTDEDAERMRTSINVLQETAEQLRADMRGVERLAKRNKEFEEFKQEYKKFMEAYDEYKALNIQGTPEDEISDGEELERALPLDTLLNMLDDKYTGPLPGEDLMEFVRSYTEILDRRNTGDKKTTSKLQAARSAGALMGIGNRLFAPSDPEFAAALSTSIEGVGFYRKGADGNQLALDINPSAVRGFGQGIFLNATRNVYTGTEIYLPQLLKDFGIDARPTTQTSDNLDDPPDKRMSRAEAREAWVNNQIAQLDNIWGKIPGDHREYKLIAPLTYDPEREVVTVISPYIQNLIIAMLDKEDNEHAAKHYKYLNRCTLLHASAANEQDQAAVEMAVYLLIGVQQRGSIPDAKLKQNKNKKYKNEQRVTYRISWKALIDRSPLAREQFNSMTETRRKTQELKRKAKRMFKILEKKTDLYLYYNDLKINSNVLPTWTTLDTEIIVTHTGDNPEYKKEPLPIKNQPAQ